MFHQILDRAEAGDQLGALVKGIKRNDIRRGQVLAKRDSIKMYNNFDAKVLSSVIYELKQKVSANIKTLLEYTKIVILLFVTYNTVILSLMCVLVEYRQKNWSVHKPNRWLTPVCELKKYVYKLSTLVSFWCTVGDRVQVSLYWETETIMVN